MLQGIEGVVCLIVKDDILIIGRDQQEHDSRLNAVLRRLQEANATLNDQLEFSVPELKCVGHLVSAADIKLDTQKIAAIIDMIMVNQLAKFSPRLPLLSLPIRGLLLKDRTCSWVGPQEIAL